jgi:hypothetical protein
VGGGDQTYARAALDPHLAIGVVACAPRAPSTPAEERAEGVGVPVGIGGPIPDACEEDVELEGEDVLEDVRAGGGRLDGGERAEQVGRFRRGLVEEAEAGEGGEAEGPELSGEREGKEESVGGSGWEEERGVYGTMCVRLTRGSRPLDSLARCGRVPSALGRANCSSSNGEWG